MTIDATIPATTTQVSNQGTVSWDGDSIVTDDPDTGAADDQTVTQVPQADLSIAKSSSPNPVETGTGQVTYTLTVTNSGPSAAQNVVVSDTLPAALTLVSTSGCTEDPSGIPTCTIGMVASGDTVDITVIANVTGSTAQLSNTATVTSTTHDPDTGDLSDTELTDTALFHDDPATLQRQKEEAITLCRRRINAAVVLFGDGMIDKEEYRRRVERNERWKQRGE